MDGKTKIYISMFILVTAVVLVQLATFSIMQQRLLDRHTDDVAGQQLINARRIADSIESDILNTINSLKLISNIPEIRSGSTEDCNEKIDEIISSMDLKIGNLVRYDENGIITCAQVKSTIGADVKVFEDTKRIIENPYESKNISISTISYSTYAERYRIAIRILLFDDEGFEGVLSGAIYADEIENKHLKNVTIAKQGYVILMDDNGDTIYHPRQEFLGMNFWSPEFQAIIKNDINLNAIAKNLAEGKSGIRRYFFEGKEKIAAYAPANILEGRSWGVVVTVPIEDIEGMLGTSKSGYDLFSVLYLFSALSSIIAILIFAFFAARLIDKREIFKGKVKRE